MYRRQFIRSVMTAGGLLALAPWRASFATEVNAHSASGKELILADSQVSELGRGLRGHLLLPGNPAYEQARLVLNPMIDKHPALIVQPSGVADVSLAVQFAKANNLVTAVKCGGHSAAGKSTVNGGLMIDLANFRHVRVDAGLRRAWVSGGSLLGALDHEALAQGLVTTSGTVSHTGVGGLATGGGFGRLGRKFGLTLDNIHAVEVVSADGQVRRASAEEHPDLYWGVRGGGGNFGVVTNFEFDLHPMNRQVLVGSYMFPFARLQDVLEFYAEFSARAPDELAIDLVLGFPPGNSAGFVMLQCVYCGDHAAGERLLQSVKQLGKPLRGSVAATDYEALQRSGDSDAPRATASYLKGGFVSAIEPALIADIVAGLEPAPGRSTMMIFQQAGGAIGRVASDATAFPHRYANYNMMATVSWQPNAPGDLHRSYIKRYWQSLIRHTHGFYTNEADDDNQSQWSGNYQGNHARLVAIKRRYDPDNIFRLNANVLPG